LRPETVAGRAARAGRHLKLTNGLQLCGITGTGSIILLSQNRAQTLTPPDRRPNANTHLMQWNLAQTEGT
jgi:hypothetical protein